MAFALISMDNEKAFDVLCVEHNFIKKVLIKFNFPPTIIKWFDILYDNIESKILINGTFTEK